jgi:hypothetical protein
MFFVHLKAYLYVTFDFAVRCGAPQSTSTKHSGFADALSTPFSTTGM